MEARAVVGFLCGQHWVRDVPRTPDCTQHRGQLRPTCREPIGLVGDASMVSRYGGGGLQTSG